MRPLLLVFAATVVMGCDGGSSESATHPGAELCPVRDQGALRLSTDLGLTGEQAWERAGVVTQAEHNEFSVETCAPGGGCSSDEIAVVIEEDGASPKLDVRLPVGAFVEVRATEQRFAFGAAQYTLTVRNLPTWESLPNPVASDTRWYLVLNEGEESVPGAPFEVDATDVDCEGDHTVDFVFAEPGGLPIAVPDGAVERVELAGQEWDIDIVRSASPYCCDFPTPYAWWAALANSGGG